MISILDIHLQNMGYRELNHLREWLMHNIMVTTDTHVNNLLQNEVWNYIYLNLKGELSQGIRGRVRESWK